MWEFWKGAKENNKIKLIEGTKIQKEINTNEEENNQMETDENKTQSWSRGASKNTETLSNENQEETQVARKIRKIKPRKINEEHPTLMKFAKMAPVAEGAAGETISKFFMFYLYLL